MGIVFTAFFIIILVSILMPSESDQNSEYPPEGYAIDYALMNHDDRNGISKAEKNRRIKSGYYLIPCDKNGCVDLKKYGRPKY